MKQQKIFIKSLKKFNNILSRAQEKKELKENIKQIIDDSATITSLLKFEEKDPRLLLIKTLNLLNEYWLNIAQDIDNIRELIDNKPNNK